MSKSFAPVPTGSKNPWWKTNHPHSNPKRTPSVDPFNFAPRRGGQQKWQLSDPPPQLKERAIG